MTDKMPLNDKTTDTADLNYSTNNSYQSNNSNESNDSNDLDESNESTLNSGLINVPRFAKKHILNDIKGLPEGIAYGWIHYDNKYEKSDESEKSIFNNKPSKPMLSLGLFEDKNKKFRQLAIADYEGRVYVGNDISVEDTYNNFPSVSLIEQQEITLKDKSRFYGRNTPNSFNTLLENIKKSWKETYDPKSENNIYFEDYKSTKKMGKEIEDMRINCPELVHEVEKISKIFNTPYVYKYPFYDDNDDDCIDEDQIDEDDCVITGSVKNSNIYTENNTENDNKAQTKDENTKDENTKDKRATRAKTTDENSVKSTNFEEKSHTFLGRIKFLLQTFSRLKKESSLNALCGDVVIQSSPFDGLHWAASWLSTSLNNHRTYTIEQIRTPLPESLRHNLSYQDAIAIAFFATYLIPDLSGSLTSFGVENIFRRLQKEAPLCAIRGSVKDIKKARYSGLRYSGLEAYYERLMHESKALKPIRSLEQHHGAETLHLDKSKVSRNYVISWDNALDPETAITVLNIEGALNRINTISNYLETNAFNGDNLTEDEITFKQAAQIDIALLEDPAFSAYPDLFKNLGDPLNDDKIKPIEAIWKQVRQERKKAMIRDYKSNNEWSYRQRLSRLIKTMYTPFRFDADFRSNIEDGNVAIGFMATESSVMPKRKYDKAKKHWVNLTDSDRSFMSTEYNLRLGIILATLAFAANPAIQNVSVRLDSIGLEDMVVANNNAINRLLSRTISAINNMMNHETPSKGEPKDGDVHGNPDQIHDSQNFDSSEVNQNNQNNQANQNNHNNLANQINATIQDTQKDESNQPIRIEKTRKTLMTVNFERQKFVKHLRKNGLRNPINTYREFCANIDIDENHALKPVEPTFDLRDTCFAPRGAQEEPEFSDSVFDSNIEDLLGTSTSQGLAIQREDLLQQAVSDFHHISSELMPTTAEKARMAMSIINDIDDPELTEKAEIITKAIIDEEPIPEITFNISKEIRNTQLKAHNQFERGEVTSGIEEYEKKIAYYDSMFSEGKSIPRYFNSYAERVIYNRMFANNNESMRLIPDGLFYAHMELADIYSQLHDSNKTLQHLRTMVSYAPTYALSHLRLATELSNNEDWDSAYAACLNALRVSLDQDDAAFAYYRLAYAEWMRDNFDSALAAYKMAENISPDNIGTLQIEKNELISRMTSQCMPIPENTNDISKILKEKNIPEWPNTNAHSIIDSAAKSTVNNGMFVIARTLCVASARMKYTQSDNEINNATQMQFLRSLNA